jgi:hypothetical protein
VVAYTCNPTARETKEGQAGLHSKTLPPKQNKSTLTVKDYNPQIKIKIHESMVYKYTCMGKRKSSFLKSH